MTLVFYPEHGVYMKRSLLPNKQLVPGKVRVAPSNDLTYGNVETVGPQSYAYSGHQSAERAVNLLQVVVQVDERLYLFTYSGLVHALPVDAKYEKIGNSPAYKFNSSFLHADGGRVTLLAMRYANDPSVADYYVVNMDGHTKLIGQAPFTAENLKMTHRYIAGSSGGYGFIELEGLNKTVQIDNYGRFGEFLSREERAREFLANGNMAESAQVRITERSWTRTPDQFQYIALSEYAGGGEFRPNEAVKSVERGGSRNSIGGSPERQASAGPAPSAARGAVVYEFPMEAFEPIRLALASPEAGSVVVTGEAGSGKSELVRAFVRKVKEGAFHEIPKNTVFEYLDVATFSAGTANRGEFETKVKELIARITGENRILIIDEIHTLRGAGTHGGSNVDFFEMLKTRLADGGVRVIGTTTHDEYKKYFKTDQALERRMPEVNREPIPRGEFASALKKWSTARGLPVLSPSVYEAIIGHAIEFDPAGIDFMKVIRLLRATYAHLTVYPKPANEVSAADITAIAVKLYGLKPWQFSPEMWLRKLEEMKRSLERELVGLDGLKREAYNDQLIAVTRASDGSMPRGRRLLAGPKGLGKTYFVEKLAESMEVPYARINMAEYGPTGKSSESLLREIGQAIQKSPYSLIFFDEIEKAHISAQNVLLRVLDSNSIVVPVESGVPGSLQTASVRFSTARATVYLATNAGQDYIRGGGRDRAGLAKAMEADGLSEFLINRAAEIHIFEAPQTAAEVRQVLRQRVETYLKQQEAERGYKFVMPDLKLFLDKLTANYFESVRADGYREVLAALDRTVSLAVAKWVQDSVSGNAFASAGGGGGGGGGRSCKSAAAPRIARIRSGPIPAPAVAPQSAPASPNGAKSAPRRRIGF
ncbi:MAG TPA: AAA family ATPase [Bdellovibrionales bacterium]|nr:AAA family ATPase [Bdellovibrionales bacterium]